MKLSQIYKMACAYICEDSDGEDARELRANAPSLLAGVIAGLIPTDSMLTGQDISDYPPYSEYSEPDCLFPLDESLCHVCAIKLGALLCADENEYLSARLNAEFEMALERFKRALPVDIEPITDVYK